MAKEEGGRQARRERLARSARYADLEKEILRLLSQNFEENSVSGVYITEGVDSDGDAILRVMVVLANSSHLDGNQLVGLVRNIRSLISDKKQFPVISFVSKADADRLDVEAA